jgi:AcrR family transcriptional regulator
VTEVVTGADGRALSRKGAATRQRLLDAAEQVFGALGFHDASIVRITEAAKVGQGTFYLYFPSKKGVFDELVRDLNRRVRYAMKEASSQGASRLEAELLGFGAYFRFTAEHPALYRIIRQAEFVSPEMLQYHYEKLAAGYVEGLRESIAKGEVGADVDPETAAWSLMATGEMLGMRYILWGDGTMPDEVEAELARLVRSVLRVPA